MYSFRIHIFIKRQPVSNKYLLINVGMTILHKRLLVELLVCSHAVASLTEYV